MLTSPTLTLPEHTRHRFRTARYRTLLGAEVLGGGGEEVARAGYPLARVAAQIREFTARRFRAGFAPKDPVILPWR